jgi:uncharacterized membrane protein
MVRRMQQDKTPGTKQLEFWNDETGRLMAVVGGIALGSYILSHPRALKYTLLLGAAEFLRRRTSACVSMPSMRARETGAEQGTSNHALITVSVDPQRAYAFWRDLAKAPQYMTGVGDVRVISETVALWKMKAVHGRSFSWVGEITDDIPGERIAWRIIGSDIVSGGGHVEFRRGPISGTTEVWLEQSLTPVVSISGWVTRSLLGRQLQETLRRFKQLLETGEIAQNRSQAEGTRTLATRITRDYVKPVLIPS